ncbi:hypothetical protein GPECTOR_59g677 [Gonium pectorale]|uniref:Uncharacterized protein n=1 Tax=Gonium pectorale TaxID=33097 RepID=A0A150G5H2_GONPE|nr:hypothetical protein GPECTOR_59g677 [Gonium pectorale]|eukprot:KXZ45068.1 hypothetical protein GPECTOR_59g677 [Gonium pectorale]
MGGQGARRKRNWRHNRPNSPYNKYRADELLLRQRRHEEQELRDAVLGAVSCAPQREELERQLLGLELEGRINMLKRLKAEQADAEAAGE